MREEFRCTEATAVELKRLYPPPVQYDPLVARLGLAFGIPVVVRDDAPAGKLQFWRDGELIQEVDV